MEVSNRPSRSEPPGGHDQVRRALYSHAGEEREGQRREEDTGPGPGPDHGEGPHDGDVEYLDRFMDTGYDFDAFADTIGGLVMGSASYEQAVGWGWMWGDRPTVVMTTRTDLPVPEGADITFRSGSTAEEVRALAER